MTANQDHEDRDCDRLLLLDRLAERLPDLDLDRQEVDWMTLPEPDGAEALLVNGGGIDGGDGVYFAYAGEDVHAVGSLQPLAPAVGCNRDPAPTAPVSSPASSATRWPENGRRPLDRPHDVCDLRAGAVLRIGAALDPTLCSGDMTIQRMDNVLIVVEDLEAPKAFFTELGMELEGETTVEGSWVDRVVGLNDVRSDIAMMRTPDGHSRVELTKFHTPPAVRAEPENAPANTLGIRRIMFAVDDIDDVVARLRSHGAELVGEIAQYEDIYRLCYLRGPEGIIIGLAEQLS